MKAFTLPRWRFTNCCGHTWGHPVEPRPAVPGGASRRDFLRTAATGAEILVPPGPGFVSLTRTRPPPVRTRPASPIWPPPSA